MPSIPYLIVRSADAAANSFTASFEASLREAPQDEEFR
jgi:hypothetical protein